MVFASVAKPLAAALGKDLSLMPPWISGLEKTGASPSSATRSTGKNISSPSADSMTYLGNITARRISSIASTDMLTAALQRSLLVVKKPAG
jgi:hypothetical protein